MGPMRLGQSKNFTDFILVLRLISSLVPSFSSHKFSDPYNMCQKTNKIMICEQFARPHKTSGGYIFKDVDKEFDNEVDKVWIMGACKKVFSFVSCVAVRGKGNINVPIKAFNAPETWPGLLTTFETENGNEPMRPGAFL